MLSHGVVINIGVNLLSKFPRLERYAMAVDGICLCGVAADVQYRVEPREVKARLDSPLVMSVMRMGHSRDLIREAIQRRLTTTGLISVFLLVSLSVYPVMCTGSTSD